MIKFILGLIFYVLIFIFFKIFGFSLYEFIIFSILISIGILFSFSKITLLKYLGFTLGLFGIIFLGFGLIYIQDYDITNYYKNKKNYLKVELNDDEENIKKSNAFIFIPRIGKIPLKNNLKITVIESDKIYYISNTKNLKTTVNIYLWDGTIIRLLPQSSITLEKIFLNEENINLSETKIKLEKGSIWFKVIKTILNSNGFNINTTYGTLVIRGTSGLVGYENGILLIHSHDSIIEFVSKTKNLIKPGEYFKAVEGNLEKIKFSEFIEYVGESLIKIINEMPKIDDYETEKYKQEIINYLKEKYGYNTINKAVELKLFIYKLFNKNYAYVYDNFKSVKSIIENKEYENIANEYIFIPVNNNIEKAKEKFLSFISNQNQEYFITYTIYNLNKALKSGNLKLEEFLNYLKGYNLKFLDY